MSKFGRKLSHLFSALVLLLSVFVALPGLAKADATKKITVTINSDGSSYSGYRIMDAKVDGDNVTYSLNDTYKDAVLKAASDAKDSSVSSSQEFKEFLKDHQTSTNSTAGEDKTLRKFADELYKELKGKDADVTLKSGANDFSTDKAGYYLLADTTAVDSKSNDTHNYSATLLAGLVNKDVTLNVKSTTPTVHKKVLEGDTDKKESERSYVDATDYAAGDTIPYMITGTISSQIKSYDTYTYYFTDELPKGLDLDESSIDVQAEKVTSGYAKGINATNATKLTKDTDPKAKDKDWNATVTKNADGTTSLKVDVHNLKNLVEDHKISTDDTIVVTYNAKLNKDAVIGAAGNVNNVKLHYSNNPYSDGEGTTNNKNAKVYTYELDVNKVTGKEALAGAGFTLYKKDASGNYKEVKVLKPEDAVTGTDSKVKNKYVFKELDQGDYKIVETTVPDGYKKGADVEFTIKAIFASQNSADAMLTSLTVNNDNLKADTATGIISTNINNYTGFVLPSTGGMGRYIFLAVGALVVVAAVAFPSLKKKKLQ
ncbi:isopeptide-forming domain-containing fimbrial protein [Lactobacillus equicursoris]|uniref:isopeptide-forming domain-containing fimbrial protein n=1 Tax=Lactobacillus equicursoris TaxID=420645 RepID=UPI003993FF81